MNTDKYVTVAKSIAKKSGDDTDKLFKSIRQLYALAIKECNAGIEDLRTRIQNSMIILARIMEAIGIDPGSFCDIE